MNIFKTWIVMAALGCVVSLANIESAAAASTYSSRHHASHGRAGHPQRRKIRHSRGSISLASRVATALAWSNSRLTQYVHGSPGRRQQLEHTARELLARPGASSHDRSMASHLLDRLRAVR